jgi:L-serine deaminase
MIYTAKNVAIQVAKFTDYCRERGMAFGESSAKVVELLGIK